MRLTRGIHGKDIYLNKMLCDHLGTNPDSHITTHHDVFVDGVCMVVCKKDATLFQIYRSLKKIVEEVLMLKYVDKNKEALSDLRKEKQMEETKEYVKPRDKQGSEGSDWDN